MDYELADKYVRNLKQLNQRLGLHDNLSLNQVVNLEGVLKIEKAHSNPEFIQAMKSLTAKVLDKFIKARQKEGRAPDPWISCAGYGLSAVNPRRSAGLWRR